MGRAPIFAGSNAVNAAMENDSRQGLNTQFPVVDLLR